MLRSRFAPVALALALLVGAPAQATDGPTIADILADQGNPDRNPFDFDILAGAVAAILDANPDSPLAAAADHDAEITTFAPVDLAFRILAVDLFGPRFWIKSETEILITLATELGIDAIEIVVLYHLVPGAVIDSATALSVPRGTPLETALDLDGDGSGEVIRVFPKRTTAVLRDLDPKAVNAVLIRRLLDIRASNGIIHGILFVLRPFPL